MADRYGMDYSNENTFSSPGGGGGSGGGGMMMTSPQASASPSTTRRPTEEKTIIPVTIRMINNLPLSNTQTLADGRELDQIKIVAAVTQISQSSTTYLYDIEDGTGSIEVKEWVDVDDSLMKVQMRDEAARDHQYVRIIGKTQVYDDKLQLMAYSVRKISSGNELTHHFLEVVESSMKWKKRNTIGGTPMGMSMMNSGMDVTANFGAGNMPSSRSVPIGQHMNEGGGDNGDQLKMDIITYLRDYGEAGGNIKGFIDNATASGKYSANEIRTKLHEMSAEGELYSTVDDDHFAYIAQ